jgi:predicted PurR-regulated permease PerM
MPLPSNPQTFFLAGLFALATMAAIYVGSSIILPVVLAVVLKLLLQPLRARPGAVACTPNHRGTIAIMTAIGLLVGLVAALIGAGCDLG